MTAVTMIKFAASTLVLGTAIAGCSQAGQGTRVAAVSELKTAKLAAKAAKQAIKATKKGNLVAAVSFSETAVAFAPRDAGYRMALGQAYLSAGRFQSAATAFQDTLTLDGGRERAALQLALAQVALGQKGEGLATLAKYRDQLPASDFGLATALAGEAAEAVRILETVTRAGEADAKARQNLAFAYALAGKWNNARVMAVQDLTPGDADARIVQWSQLARPTNASDQVAAVLGVTPVVDAGQPTRLALAPTPATAEQVADAAPAAAPLPAPVEVAASLVPPPMFDPEAEAQVFETVAAPVPMVMPLTPRAARTVVPAPRTSVPTTINRVASGRFVVQLGAFENVAVAEDAWNRLSRRHGLSGYEPANAIARVNASSFVRLSVGGFASASDAARVCTRIRARGDACFVRGAAGDVTAQWVQRRGTKLASR